MTFTASKTPPQTFENQSAYWFLFQDGQVLMQQESETQVSLIEITEINTFGLTMTHQNHIGVFNGKSCFVGLLSGETTLPSHFSFFSIRALFEWLDTTEHQLVSYAYQILIWSQNHQFCGHCGTKTVQKENEFACVCPQCGLTNYPRISPAVIVAITKGNEILLARSPRYNRFSVLAGYLEPSETLEECVAREVMEEVGVKVKNIRYFGNQPWPFPHTLMVGFTADYDGGEIVIDDDEIIEAGWYTKDNLPNLPRKESIARQLVDWFIAQEE